MSHITARRRLVPTNEAVLRRILDDRALTIEELRSQLATLRRLWSEMPAGIRESLRQYQPEKLEAFEQALGVERKSAA